jgi:hypothetical protein
MLLEKGKQNKNILSFYIQILSHIVKPSSDTLLRHKKYLDTVLLGAVDTGVGFHYMPYLFVLYL